MEQAASSTPSAASSSSTPVPTSSQSHASSSTSSPSSEGRRHFKIGSRESQLAMIQTRHVEARLVETWPGLTWEIETRKTLGDKILDVALAKIGDKGLFTKELETGMLTGETDLAVHSLKDMPTRLPEGLVIGAILEREVANDALVVNEKNRKHAGLAELPHGSVIGSSSLRRRAQLIRRFPHLVFKDVRGNLNTRLRKLDDGEYDGLILACAGLQRLGLGDRIQQTLPEDLSLYAVGQGALAVECRANDPVLLPILANCQVPVGVHTHLRFNSSTGGGATELFLRGIVLSVDGQRAVEGERSGPASDPEAIGIELAKDLKSRGAAEILKEIFALARPSEVIQQHLREIEEQEKQQADKKTE